MYPIFVLTGATCTGKTDIAVSVAERTNAIILPLDQLQRYKHLKEGVGLDLNVMRKVDYFGYQILSPWEISGPEEYTAWLKRAILKYSHERPILIEGCCTTYLRRILELQMVDSLFGRLEIVALDVMLEDPSNSSRIEKLCSLEKVQRIIEETEILEREGFISDAGLPLLLECEQLFKHPEHSDINLAWAIRISAKVYCPSYLALKKKITVPGARERIISNIKEIQAYQSRRIHSSLPSKSLYQKDRKDRLRHELINALCMATP